MNNLFVREFQQDMQRSGLAEVVGMEGFGISLFASKEEMENHPTMGMPAGRQKPPLLIRKGRDGVYRIYFNAYFTYDPSVMVGFYRFLNTLTETDNVVFILGAKQDETMAHLIGGLLSAIHSCKAKTHAVCAGMCSVMETMIWCYCDTRDMWDYGALNFGVTDIVGQYSFFDAYFDAFLQKAKSLGMVNEEDIKNIKNGADKLVMKISDI